MEDQYNLYDLVDLWHWIRSGRNRRLLNKRTINMPRLPPSPPSPQEVPRSWGTGPQFSPHMPTVTRRRLRIPILVRDSSTFRKCSDWIPNSGGALPHPCVFFGSLYLTFATAETCCWVRFIALNKLLINILFILMRQHEIIHNLLIRVLYVPAIGVCACFNLSNASRKFWAAPDL